MQVRAQLRPSGPGIHPGPAWRPRWCRSRRPAGCRRTSSRARPDAARRGCRGPRQPPTAEPRRRPAPCRAGRHPARRPSGRRRTCSRCARGPTGFRRRSSARCVRCTARARRAGSRRAGRRCRPRPGSVRAAPRRCSRRSRRPGPRRRRTAPTRNPGVNGPNPSRAVGSDEKLTILIVRPWKLFSATMMFARPSGTPLTSAPHLRATFRPLSTASAPEFIGSTMSLPHNRASPAQNGPDWRHGMRD